MIADDHQLFADGLNQALSALPDMRVVGVVGDGGQLVTLLKSQPADVLLVDIDMPGVDGIETLKRLPRPTKALVVTMHADAEHAQAAREAGAAGIFSKGAPLSELAAAVRAVAAGEELFAWADVNAVLGQHRSPVLDPGAESLTQREIEILRLLAKGVSSTEDLADRLYISQKTVKNHLASIFNKLSVSDRTQAAIEAIRLGLASPK
jgi:DNA-binding NarL/FixJ family response regulator